MSLASSLAEEIRNGACQILDNLADGVDFSRSILNPIFNDPGTGSIVNDDGSLLTTLPFVNVPRGLGALLCNREPVPAPLPDYPGGQCDGVKYLVSWTNITFGGSACNEDGLVTSPTERVWGPVLYVRLVPFSPCSFTSECNTKAVEIRCRGLAPANGGTPGPMQTLVRGVGSCSTLSRITGLTVTRRDGLPDDCGNSPWIPLPPPTPGYNNIINNNFTFIDNQGNNITIPLALVYFRPEIDLNGNFKIPVDINLGGIDLGGTIDPDGNVEITPPQGRRPQLPGGSPSDGGGGNDAPPVPPDTPDPVDRIPSDPSEERKMIGVVVTVTNLQNQRATEIGQIENPPIYAPNLGFVNFFYQVDTKRGAWSKDFPVKNRNQFIPVDYEKGAIDVKGTPQGGVEWELTPIYDKTFDRSPILEPIT